MEPILDSSTGGPGGPAPAATRPPIGPRDRVACFDAQRRCRCAVLCAMPLTLGASEPRAGDLEERQLQNIIEEMAIAAGLRPPRVVLLDGDGANAALVGASDADATIVVSRGLLDTFTREET